MKRLALLLLLLAGLAGLAGCVQVQGPVESCGCEVAEPDDDESS